jgi:adenosylhomocysteine nucleosidase
MTTCAVVGMEAEAEIIRQACPNALIVVGAGDALALSSRLEAAIAGGADRIVSTGICGGLDPALRVGDAMIGTMVRGDMGEVLALDADWAHRLWVALRTPPAAPFPVSYGRFAWSPTAVARMADKAALRASTSADCVDEETFIAAKVAAVHGLPCAALRIVCDPAYFELPPAALVHLTAKGADNIGEIIASIAGDIWQIPELVELAGLSATAMGNLRAVLARAEEDFGA